jgi:hypothetical protein
MDHLTFTLVASTADGEGERGRADGEPTGKRNIPTLPVYLSVRLIVL